MNHRRHPDSDRVPLVHDGLLHDWVHERPPRGTDALVFDVKMFEDLLPSGYRVTDIVSQPQSYVAILRVRRG